MAFLMLLTLIQLTLGKHAAAAAATPAILSNFSSGFAIASSAADTSSPILESSDGAYQLKFVRYSSNKLQDGRLLAIVNTQFNTTVVWIANRNNPVSPNATLYVEILKNSTLSGARVVLADATTTAAEKDQGSVWLSPVGVHSVEMNVSGNLIMRDSLRNLLWQSFDYPTDVMVPGQFLTAGHSLMSSTAWNDVSAGSFTLREEPGGPVLYATFDAQQTMVPYQVLSYITGVGGPYSEALNSPCNRTVLIYRSDVYGFLLAQMYPNGTFASSSDITPECRAADKQYAHGLTFYNHMASNGFRYLKVMPNGDINSFVLDSNGLHLEDEILRNYYGTYCGFPSYCGTNSLCSSISTCTCPSLFSPIDKSDASQGCRLDTPLDCSISTQHQFLPLPGSDYFANAFLHPTAYVNSPDKCTGLCLRNCSCTVAFFNNETGRCFLYDTAQTLRSGANPSVTAYLRVAKLPSSMSGANTLSKAAIAGISVGTITGVMILVLLGAWAGSRYVRQQDTEESDDEEVEFLESLPGLPTRYSYKDLETATEGFSKKVGEGGSGVIYEGHIDMCRSTGQPPNGEDSLATKVAIKDLKLSELSTVAASSKKQFRAEVATLGRLSHINLVQLKGFCVERSHRLLIYEFLDNGSLDNWIFSTDLSKVLPWEKRYRIAVDTARGLAFLHEGSRDKVLHLDVKPQNILLDKIFRAKLSDFGLAKMMQKGDGAASSQTLTFMRGTPGYMAPEWFLNLPITEKSDVFSYGMMLLELVGGRKNVKLDADADDDWYFPAWAVKQTENGNLLEIIDKRLWTEPSKDSNSCQVSMTRLIQVAFWCIQENAVSRPSMSTILLMLEQLIEIPDPPLDLVYILPHTLLNKKYDCHPPPSFSTISSTKFTTSNASNITTSLKVVEKSSDFCP